MKLDSIKTASRILCWLGLFAISLMSRESMAADACTSGRFNLHKDIGCNQPTGRGVGAPQQQTPCPCGMPRWWVSEPYLDLCMKDKPLSYTMSSGQEMSFRFYYRQRTQLPGADQVTLPTAWYSEDYPGFKKGATCGTNASWGLNWNLSVTIWDPAWEANWSPKTSNPRTPPGDAPYNDGYHIFVWQPEGGIDYYNVPGGMGNTVNPKNNVRIAVNSANTYPSVWTDMGFEDVANTPTADTNGIYWGDSGVGIKLISADGSQDVYSLSAYAIVDYSLDNATLNVSTAGTSTERLFLTQRIDPQGRITKLGYEHVPNSSAFRLKYVVDPDKRTSTLTYSSGFQLTQIADPYGRTAQMTYNSDGWLASLKDAAGLTSSFQYQAGSTKGWISSLTTPYGTTSFNYYQVQDPTDVGTYFSQLALYASEPTGAQQLYFYIHNNPFQAASENCPIVPGITNFDNGSNGGMGHNGLNWRNTYHWGQRQFDALASYNTVFASSLSNSMNLYQASASYIQINPTYSQSLATNSQIAFANALASLSAADFNKAELKHWLLSSDDNVSISDSLSSDRDPSPDAAGQIPGLRTWYNYPGKSSPELSGSPQISCIAKLLPDGTSQYATYNYYPSYPTGSGLLSDSESSYTLPNGTVGELTNWFVYAANSVDLASISNSAGQFVNYAYNGQHQITAMTNTLGQVTSWTWNPNLVGVQWPAGKTVTLNYYDAQTSTTNTSSMVQQVIVQPEGRTYTFNDYSASLPASITDDHGLTVANTWDGLNRLTSVTFPDATTISNVYGLLDVVAAKDRLNHWTYYSYDGLEHLTTISNANHAVTSYSWCGCGSLTAVLDALANLTTLNYDNQGNLTSLVFPDNSSLTYQYDLAGRLTNAVDGAGNGLAFVRNNQGLVTAVNSSYGSVQQTLYDALNRPVSVTDANGITVTSQYDAINELVTRTWPDGIGEGYGYSAAGLTAFTNRDQKITLYGRDAAGRLTAVTNANHEITRFGYDSLDHVASLVDGLKHSTAWQYNEYGWLTNKVDGDGRQAFVYGYDANGRVQSRWTPEKGGTAYTYDAVGNLINVAYAHSSISYAYDALNRLTNLVDAVGTTTFGYTPAGQLLSENGPWASDTVTNGYTQQLRTALGLVQPGQSGGAWQQNYSYDAARRLTTVASPAGTFNYVLGGHGAASSLVASQSLPNGGSITNGYDALARLQVTALNNASGVTLDGYGYAFDAEGLRTNITRNLGTAASTVSIAYDALGQLTNWVAREGAGTARLNEQLSWSYDAADNLHTRANNALGETFSVDAANQLTGVARSGTLTVAGNTLAAVASLTVNGQAATVYGDQTFAQAGNALNNGANTYTNIAQNSAGQSVTNLLTVNLPASATLLYDGNGNLTNDGLRSFAYDTENELTNVRVAGQWQSAFVYDGLGRRRIERDYAWSSGVWVPTNEVHYVYDGRLILQERDASNNVVVTYTRGRDLSGTVQDAGGIGGLLARTDASSTNYYHADGAGNITALVNGLQTIVARYLYNAFGQVEGKWGPLADANTMQFSSMPRHNLSGLSLYAYRAYDPNFQRWLNHDPIGERGGLNLYRAMGNDPVNEIDPYGLDNFYAGGPTAGTYNNNVPNITLSGSVGGGPVNTQFNGGGLGDPIFLLTLETGLPIEGAVGAMYYSGGRVGLAAKLLLALAAGHQSKSCPPQPTPSVSSPTPDNTATPLPAPISPDTLVPIVGQPGQFIRYGDIPYGSILYPGPDGGYSPDDNHVMGSAIGDIMNLEQQ